MLSDILIPFCLKTGYDIIQQRTLALEWINRGADEIYKNLEPDDALSEVCLAVPANMQLTLPSYVGELRAVREYKYSTTIPIQSIGSPMYSSDTWQFLWRNWRLKGTSPLHTSMSNVGVLSLNIPVIDNSVVTVNMQTATGARVIEQITMNALVVVTTNSPTKIFSISSATLGRLYDITINDINGIEIATLHNNEKHTRYRVIDVSEFQWGSYFSATPNTNIAQLLYKPTLYPYYYDTDEFIALDFDAAIQYKALELYYQGQENKETDVILYSKKATQAMDIATRNQEAGENKQLLFQPNAVYKAFGRLKNRQGFGQNNYFSNGGMYPPA